MMAGCASMAHASKDAQLPDWVSQAVTAAPLKADWHDAKAVYLLEATLLTVSPDGRRRNVSGCGENSGRRAGMTPIP